MLSLGVHEFADIAEAWSYGYRRMIPDYYLKRISHVISVSLLPPVLV